MTMTQKILSRHSGGKKLQAGDVITISLDAVMANDITAPVAIKEFKNAGLTQVFDKDKVIIVLDHFAPNKDISSAVQCKYSRDFAFEQGLTNFYDVGKMGIEHALIPEKGLVTAGETFLGAESHTCTYGALNAFSMGSGSTDMACGMACGKMWVKVPSAIKVVLTGKPQKNVGGKDVILHLIGLIGVDGALYKSLEFFGDGISHLSMDDRFTIANMAIEAGAKNGIFPFDDKTKAYIDAHCNRPYEIATADDDAVYERTVQIDLSALEQTVAFPHLPENTKPMSAITEKIEIQQSVIGSCTNGRLEDLRIAAEIFAGKQVHDKVRCLVFPATQRIYMDAMEKGYIKTLIEAGCAVSTPTCGPCIGGHLGVLAEHERCISTTNRNFVGRMGHITSEIYLASPAVAAASAIAGYITGGSYEG